MTKVGCVPSSDPLRGFERCWELWQHTMGSTAFGGHVLSAVAFWQAAADWWPYYLEFHRPVTPPSHREPIGKYQRQFQKGPCGVLVAAH